MKERVLVTGGAGFIGSHLADELLAAGYNVRVFDNLEPQVHGPNAEKPEYLSADAEFIKGDLLDADALRRALDGVDWISHQAALVGVAQSMYAIARYTRANVIGTANLLELLVNDAAIRDRVQKIVVASSMSVYGEGKAYHPSCGEFMPPIRPLEQLKRGEWEVRTATGDIAEPRPTDERQLITPVSIYAANKLNQEQMVLAIGHQLGISAAALRYFGVYGPRQSLRNPYTGVAAIFCSRILHGNPPLIYEDGEQTRDFIHVTDIARANRLALERPEAAGKIYNVGTGRRLSVNAMAARLIELLAPGAIEPRVTGQFRAGDIRHCFADASKIARELGFTPAVKFEDGIAELAESVRAQHAEDRTPEAAAELERRGLTL